MFNKGNLGAKGEEGIIEELKNKQDFQILILQDKYKKNWQTPLKVIEYVKKEFKKADENKDGAISKDEFKVELKKKLEFYANDNE